MSAMYDPPHPGELLRDAIKAKGWTVSDAASRMGVARNTLSRVLNGRAASRPAWRSLWSASVGSYGQISCMGG